MFEIGEEVSIGNELSDKAEGLLECDAAHHVDDVGVVALGYLFHHVNLFQKGSLFFPGRCCCSATNTGLQYNYSHSVCLSVCLGVGAYSGTTSTCSERSGKVMQSIRINR